jgi:hypothetical protein
MIGAPTESRCFRIRRDSRIGPCVDGGNNVSIPRVLNDGRTVGAHCQYWRRVGPQVTIMEITEYTSPLMARARNKITRVRNKLLHSVVI